MTGDHSYLGGAPPAPSAAPPGVRCCPACGVRSGRPAASQVGARDRLRAQRATTCWASRGGSRTASHAACRCWPWKARAHPGPRYCASWTRGSIGLGRRVRVRVSEEPAGLRRRAQQWCAARSSGGAPARRRGPRAGRDAAAAHRAALRAARGAAARGRGGRAGRAAAPGAPDRRGARPAPAGPAAQACAAPARLAGRPELCRPAPCTAGWRRGPSELLPRSCP